MVTLVAFAVLQLKAADWPDTIDAGDALNVTVGAGVDEVTVTVALAVTEPAALVALSV
jgi:hypothetical protein